MELAYRNRPNRLSGTPRLDIGRRSRNWLIAKSHYKITWADAIRAHEEALKVGGAAGIIDENGIRSAIGRPYDGYHRRIYQKAAALVESLIQNHGFADGNKRTSLYLVNVLIEKSGYRLNADPETIVETFVSVAEGNDNYSSLVDWFRERLHRSSKGKNTRTSESNDDA